MRSSSSRLRRARPLLGTFVEISVHGGAAAASAAIERAFGAIARVHALMSFHEAGSDVSRVNRAAHRAPVGVDPCTYAVLEEAARIAELSEGAFDVTVAPQLVRCGVLPASAEPVPLARTRGFEAIELLPGHRVRFAAPTWIDLGGIAKGYAVDLACGALERAGISDYLVNAGGDLRVGARAEIIHVRHPACPQAPLELGAVQSAAIATSAAYFAGRPGATGAVHPIIAPATGRPAPYRGSISVEAPSCTTADALTKVVAVRGSDAAPLLRRLGAAARLLSEAGTWQRLEDWHRPSHGVRRDVPALGSHA